MLDESVGEAPPGVYSPKCLEGAFSEVRHQAPVQMGHNNPERAGYTEEMAILEELRRETDQAIELYRTEVGFER